MSDHDEPPSFSGSGDPREEALWEAYQAMLKRRKDPRARWSPPEETAPGRAPGPADSLRSLDAPPTPPRPMAAQRIPPRPPEARPSERGAIVFQPIEEAGIEAPPPPFTLSQSARAARGRGRWRAVLGVAVLLTCGAAALAIVRWPHGAAPPIAAANRGPGVVAGTSVSGVPPQRQSLPCFVDGQLIGEFTLEDCTSRNGVASGSLQARVGKVDAGPRAAPPATPQLAPRAGAETAQGVPQSPSPALPSPLPAPARLAAREPPFEPPRASRPPPRIAAPRAIGEPSRTLATRYAVAEQTPPPEAPPRRAAALAVREFYDALSQGDGARAAAVVTPEVREDGPLSAEALTQFYSSLRAPLRVTKIDPINDDTVFVRYQFITRDDRLCLGSATVNTTRRNGETLVRGIRAFNGC